MGFSESRGSGTFMKEDSRDWWSEDMLSSVVRFRERSLALSKEVTRSARLEGTRFSDFCAEPLGAVAAEEPPVGWTALAAPDAPERAAARKAPCGEEDDVEGRPSMSFDVAMLP